MKSNVFSVVDFTFRGQKFYSAALYTGKDDNIVTDLLTTYRFKVNGEPAEKKIVDGLHLMDDEFVAAHLVEWLR